MRKIVQISAATDGCAAVCDDGTVWALAFGESWRQLPPIPQPEKVNIDDGWIEWNGGECPVPNGTLVDVKYRNCSFGVCLPANKNVDNSPDVDAGPAFWANCGMRYDIVAYRLHQKGADK